MNPILEMLSKTGPMAQAFQNFGSIASALKSGNPLGAMTGDPRMKQVQDYIQSHGGNPEQVFYALAREKGVDPNQILEQVRSMMK